ncbi:MAG: HD domain-containing protein [Candidatus Cloacimonadota bacterium]|nr:MAG: HD domain-containing protein [Candidatus Cloacimonadota bacterium]
MKDKDKKQDQHTDELARLRRRIAELEALEAAHKKAEETLRKSKEHYRFVTETALSGIMTERERGEEKFRRVFENAPIGIYRTTPDGRIIMANPAIVHMLGYSSSEALVQLNLEGEEYPPEYPRSEFKQRINRKGKILGLESTWTRKDGKQIFVRESARAFFDDNGKPLYYEGMVEDITERKLVEEELRKARDELEIRVKERTAELVYINKQMEREITDRKHVEDELKQSLETEQNILEGIVKAMAIVVEARDPYTAGHQQRVAELACALAKEMNLSEKQIEGIRIAGLLHDIGKINIPSEILSKPGRLTEIEFSLIKNHPQVSYDILKGIEFPWYVDKIVLQHHERLDGSGYPAGLGKEDILIEAKILGVADVVEAMSSHRPYRAALGIDKALGEILEHRGVLYEPEVVNTCINLFAEKKFELNQKNRKKG